MYGMMHCMHTVLKHRHLLLAAFIAAFLLFELFGLKAFTPLENRLADLLLRQYAEISQPDPDIVIIDIDERSLALMSESVGRWPWPRSMHAELLAGIAQQRPKAVVFDILFSDPDRMRPEGDAYFAETIRATDNTYFPMLRLNDADDAQGIPLQKYGTVLGARPGKQADPQASVAMVLPLPAMLETGRIGTHNAVADADGVVRQYPIYISIDGWRIPSLPTALARDSGWTVPDSANIILNWHGRAVAYPRVSYADVYQDLQRKNPQRPQDEFAGKIVIIGATANGLHDVRPPHWRLSIWAWKFSQPPSITSRMPIPYDSHLSEYEQA
jgi:adenylate cyclase